MSLSSAHSAAIVTWVYAAGFGLPAVPVTIYLLRHGSLPWLWNLFPMYGGPWSARFADKRLAVLLIMFLLVTVLVSVAAWLVWNGSRTGVIVSLAMIPVEAIFWYGFALPFPVLFGIARVVLLALAWRSLSGG